MIDTRMTNAQSDAEAHSVGGETIPQGLPTEVARMWQSEQMLRMAVPLARRGTTEEAANGILFLASPQASYITGHTLEVTGGMGI